MSIPKHTDDEGQVLRSLVQRFLGAALPLFAAISLVVPGMSLPQGHSSAELKTHKKAVKVSPADGRATLDYGSLPLSFEMNQGQLHRNVKFLARGAGSDIYLTSKETILSLRKPTVLAKEAVNAQRDYVGGRESLFASQDHKSVPMTSDVVKMKLVGANDVNATGQNELPGIVNYFIGKDPRKWHTNIRTFGKVEYKNVYTGIDQVFYGVEQQLEYDFIVSPGANHRVIRLAFKGVERLYLDQGDLVLQIKGSEEIRFRRPFAYQELNNGKQKIHANYVIRPNHQVGFEIGDYDTRKPLIIDPVLAYSTYLGGGGNDAGFDVTVDGNGNAYVTGSTDSAEFSSLGGSNAFVAKLNPAGTQRTYLAIIGGSGDDTGFSLAVDNTGNAYVTGSTDSVNFPVSNSVQSNFGGGSQDAFVAKLNPTGSGIAYATYFGGTGNDTGFSVAIDSTSNAYVTGSTDSIEFSTLGNTNAFVMKLNSSGNERSYLSILGGGGDGTGFDIAVDGTGSACIVGSTDSTNFTIANALQPNFGGSQDVFVAKLTPSGSSLVYSTYLGGTGNDSGFGVAVDGSGNTYVTGSTDSIEFSSLGGRDVFVTKFNSTGSDRTYFTILGGNGDDAGFAIAVDSSGGSYVTGSTDSSNFTTTDALQPTAGGSQDLFIAKLNPAGSTLTYSTFVGSSSNESGFAIAADNAGNAYVTGFTSSNNFPTASPSQPLSGGNGDAFILKISASAPLATLQFTSTNYSVSEDGANASLMVSRAGDVAQAASVNYTTSNGSATGGTSCAAGVDYISASGTLGFSSGEVIKAIAVQICDDNISEGNETINLTLSNPTGGVILGAPTNSTLTIGDNETQAGCVFTLAATSQSFSSSAGIGSVGVIAAPANCGWIATSNAPWIIITSGVSGTGNGTVGYSVAASPGSIARGGTITIAGQAFTVNQGGPTLLVDGGTNHAVALDSVTLLRGPFRILTNFNFSGDRHTRVILFTSDLGLSQPDPAKLTVKAGSTSLVVENVGTVTGVTGLAGSYIIVRLPDGLPPGDWPLVVTLNGAASSNSPILGISP